MFDLADHGREIRWDEYSDLDRFALHCARASEVVNRWPAWKRNMLNNSPTRGTPRFSAVGTTTGRTSASEPPKPQGLSFALKDAARSESMQRLFRVQYGKVILE